MVASLLCCFATLGVRVAIQWAAPRGRLQEAFHHKTSAWAQAQPLRRSIGPLKSYRPLATAARARQLYDPIPYEPMSEGDICQTTVRAVQSRSTGTGSLAHDDDGSARPRLNYVAVTTPPSRERVAQAPALSHGNGRVGLGAAPLAGKDPAPSVRGALVNTLYLGTPAAAGERCTLYHKTS
jgi:hypothetical protein